MRDLMRRPPGPPHSWVNPFKQPLRFLGLRPEWGFTKPNELFQGK